MRNLLLLLAAMPLLAITGSIHQVTIPRVSSLEEIKSIGTYVLTNMDLIGAEGTLRVTDMTGNQRSLIGCSFSGVSRGDVIVSNSNDGLFCTSVTPTQKVTEVTDIVRLNRGEFLIHLSNGRKLLVSY
jgi:hypothetical protein